MNILIIGGTRFVGRHLVEVAAARKHTLTLFHRGQTNAGVYPDVEHLIGDRLGDLSALEGREWDAVIDTSGYFPRAVRRTCEVLRDRAGQYAFVSSVSVYADSKRGYDESGPLATLADESVEEITGETYGGLKVLCEREVTRAFAARALIVRPGLIVGKYDPTDRFTYWPWRIAQGGDVLAPGRPERVVQIIDARDLAEFVLRLIEANASGVFNATGPAATLTMGEIVAVCQRASDVASRIHWLSEEFLLANNVQAWSELPVWVPESDPDTAGFMFTDIRKALAAGLSFHALDDTVRETLAYARSRPADHVWRAGLTREREAELLTANIATP